MELWESTASPLTPSLCPPAEFASGRTYREGHELALVGPGFLLGRRTIGDALPLLTNHSTGYYERRLRWTCVASDPNAVIMEQGAYILRERLKVEVCYYCGRQRARHRLT